MNQPTMPVAAQITHALELINAGDDFMRRQFPSSVGLSVKPTALELVTAHQLLAEAFRWSAELLRSKPGGAKFWSGEERASLEALVFRGGSVDRNEWAQYHEREAKNVTGEQRYRVECLKSEDAEGHQEWVLAARRGPKMDNGPALAIGGDEAIRLLNVLECEGQHARILEA